MNNSTTASAPLRITEMTAILQLQVLGLITRDGQGQFTPTEKLFALQSARHKEDSGDILTLNERRLLTECASVVSD